jgi:hypothetical protein
MLFGSEADVKRRILLIALLLGLAGVALALYLRVDRGPHDQPLPPITHEYFACEKCGSLDGGIYGKGPVKHFRTKTGHWCVHDWRLIDRAEFKRQATEVFGVDWSKEIPFWPED